MDNNPARFCENCPCNSCVLNQSMEIIDFPNYRIFKDGRVYSMKTNRFLKSQTNNCGYIHVGLCNDGKQKTFSIHRLLAIHYIENPDNKSEVDHINRDNRDNRIENLRWVSRSENNQNKDKQINNKSGHKNISYRKHRDTWKYEKVINGKKVVKIFDSKIDALCYKYINQLKLKVQQRQNLA
tara:strand:- start:1310 stop:1855 length:546 start_codon:yes stop_codon:yes gene_type:complete